MSGTDDSGDTFLFSATDAARADAAPKQLAGRYTLLGLLGEGGGGQVYEGRDEVTGAVVALKRLRGGHARREVREIAALRRLNVPGVVRLLDELVEEDGRWFVMERIYGEPFPGPLVGDPIARWERLAPTVRALLETLTQVHDEGMVHRDLKPDNVLVQADGSPVVLDFGLVRGSVLGSTITAAGALLGTPIWIAPEQLMGGEVDGRADLYAVGSMIYAALAGRPPFPGEAWSLRTQRDPPDLLVLCPGLPIRLARAIHAMLARIPEHRPPTAAAAWRALRGEAASDQLPWLGSRVPVDALLVAARLGASALLGGAPGTGRTRCLREVAAVLEREGRPVAWVMPASRPFGSLAGVVAPATDSGDVSEAVRAGLLGWLQTGVLIVDDTAIDRWTRRLLASLHDRGVILHVAGPDEPAEVSTSPLTEEDLRPLFLGPDAFLHLSEDSAALMFARTRGLQVRVDLEARAWVRAQVARWEQGQLRVSRSGLDRLLCTLRVSTPAERELDLEPSLARLLAWIQLATPHGTVPLLARLMAQEEWMVGLEVDELQRLGAIFCDDEGHLSALVRPRTPTLWRGSERLKAHRLIADALPSRSLDRIQHLLAADAGDEVCREATSLARVWRLEGRAAAASALLLEVLRYLQQSSELPHTYGFEEELVLSAVAQEAPAVLRETLHHLERGHTPPWQIALLRAAVALATGDHQRAEALLIKAGAPPTRASERVWWDLRVRAAWLAGDERIRLVVEQATDWARDAGLLDDLAYWEGRQAYRSGDYQRAADCFRRAAAQTDDTGRQLDALLEAARAMLETGDLDGGASVADEAVALAIDTRRSIYEARAIFLARAARARGETPPSPRPDLVDALSVLDTPALEGRMATVEAWAAWRSGRREEALLMAERAERCLSRSGTSVGVLYARAMSCSFRPDDVSEGDARSLVEETRRCPLPEVVLDVLALLASAGLLPADELPQLAALARSFPNPRLRRGVFSPAEAIELAIAG